MVLLAAVTVLRTHFSFQYLMTFITKISCFSKILGKPYFYCCKTKPDIKDPSGCHKVFIVVVVLFCSYVHECFAYMYVCVHVCAWNPRRFGRVCQIPYNWSYGLLWAAKWCWDTNPSPLLVTGCSSQPYRQLASGFFRDAWLWPGNTTLLHIKRVLQL